MDHVVSRLVLGTAQWGLPYGVANRIGRVSDITLSQMLREAWRGGIRTLDTAQAYGVSEERIGRLANEPWEIVTKLPPDLAGAGDVVPAIQRSLARLGRDSLDVLMLHRPAHRHIPSVWDHLLEAKHRGITRRVGVSVLSVDEAAREAGAVDAIQVPASLLDQRLSRTGFFRRSEPRVFVRSVFLQGIAAMDPAHLPPATRPLAESITRVQDLAKGLGTSVPALLLRYARDRFKTEVVVGMETVQQLQENLTAWSAPVLEDDIIQALEERIDPRTQEEAILNPARWAN